MGQVANYYANLLILQYKGKPKAYATIQAQVTPIIMDELPVKVQDAFNLIGDETAEGVQLDVLGKYVGVTRSGNGFVGPVTLNDDNFLKLIRMAIIRNAAESSLAAIQALIHTYFGNEIRVFDYQNMRMSYLISFEAGSNDLIQLFITEGLLPKPMGVELAVIIYAPTIDNFFGFRTYQNAAVNASPFNTYANYQSGRPWLSYANGI